MKTSQDDKCSGTTKKTGEVRMGREVVSKSVSGSDSGKGNTCSGKKDKTREDRASSLV